METVAEIIAFLARIIFECLIIWTGEIVLYVITFGRHKPRWDMYLNDSPGKFVIFSEASFWVGVGFWVIVVTIAGKMLFGG